MASVGRFAEIQFLLIVLEKRASYAPGSAQVFGNHARIMLFSLNYMLLAFKLCRLVLSEIKAERHL